MSALAILEGRSRLTAAGQVLQPNNSCRRNLPFVILRGDRPLHLLQRPLNSNGPHDVPSDSYPPRRPTFDDPLQSLAHVPDSGPSGLKCQRIQRAGRATRRHLEHMRVDHRGGYVRMPQQLLHLADVCA